MQATITSWKFLKSDRYGLTYHLTGTIAAAGDIHPFDGEFWAERDGGDGEWTVYSGFDLSCFGEEWDAVVVAFPTGIEEDMAKRNEAYDKQYEAGNANFEEIA